MLWEACIENMVVEMQHVSCVTDRIECATNSDEKWPTLIVIQETRTIKRDGTRLTCRAVDTV